MGVLSDDLRYGLRILSKSPGFAAIAVLTLALGIGANTAIFSLIDAVMLHSLPVRDPQNLVLFSWKAQHEPKSRSVSSYGDCGANTDAYGCSFSLPLFEKIRSDSSAFSGLTAFAGPIQLSLSGNGPAGMARGEIVSGDYFSTLGVKAALGRVLGPPDDSPSAPAAVVLSHGYWQSSFGRDPAAIGRAIRLNGAPFTIVGVADPQFTTLSPGKGQDFWVPIATMPSLSMSWLSPEQRRDPRTWWVVIVGRLKGGVPIGQAQAFASFTFRNEMIRGATPFLKESDDPRIQLTPVQEGLTGVRGSYSTLLYVLMSAVGLILLIACANVAGLTLARSAAREKEVALRLALGAGRGRIARQLLTESLVLSALGGALGVLVAYWGVDAVTALMSADPDRPFRFVVSPDWRILLFTISVSLLTGVLFGLAPALRSTRVDIAPTLKGSPSSPGQGARGTARAFRLGDALVVAQVALSILVLIGAGLLVRTLRNLRNLDPGFDTRNVLLFAIDPTLSSYKNAQIRNLYRDLRDRFAAIPGVESVSYSSDALLADSLWTTSLRIPGQSAKSGIDSDVFATGPGFFSTMRIPLLTGRLFTPADFASAAATSESEEARNEAKKAAGSASGGHMHPALPPLGARTPVLVNDAFVRKILAGKNPLGQVLDDNPDDPADESAGYQIIGVVGDTKYSDLRREIKPTMYVPHTEGGAHFELRVAADPMALIGTVREIVNKADSNLPLFDIRTQSQQIDQLLVKEHFMARLSSFFGILALVLACLGLYGLLSYEVTRRTREIGIRMALGAQQNQVLQLIVRQGIIVALLGAAFGIAVAVGIMRYLASLLYAVRPFDPLTFAGVVVVLLVVAVAACYIPARRATRVDPLVALRYE